MYHLSYITTPAVSRLAVMSSNSAFTCHADRASVAIPVEVNLDFGHPHIWARQLVLTPCSYSPRPVPNMFLSIKIGEQCNMIKAGRCDHDPSWTSPFRGVQVQRTALIGPRISCKNQCVAEQSVHHTDIKLLTLYQKDRIDEIRRAQVAQYNAAKGYTAVEQSCAAFILRRNVRMILG